MTDRYLIFPKFKNFSILYKNIFILSLGQGAFEIAVHSLFQKAQACQQRLSKEISDFLAMVKSLDVTKGKNCSYTNQFVPRQLVFSAKQHVL